MKVKKDEKSEGDSFGLRTEREVRVLYEGRDRCGSFGIWKMADIFSNNYEKSPYRKMEWGIGSHEVLTSRSIISHFWSGVK